LLAEEGTGLRQIAANLLAPPLSGFFLSRTAISALARQQALPRGFGNRQQLLLNLLRSAAQYDQFPTLVTALREAVAAWDQAYAAQAEAAPTLATTVTVWQARLQETGEMLDGLAEAAAAALHDG
jgi:hypothetical protein